jgi:hypothetical protein
MRFFARVTFLLNLCFIAFGVLRYFENKKQVSSGNMNNIIPLSYIEGTLVVLGLIAVVVNLIFCLINLPKLFKKNAPNVERWIIGANFIFLVCQFLYFFIYNDDTLHPKR